MRLRPGPLLAALLLTAQVLLIGYARTTEARYFCWAPFDMQTDYRLQVTVNDRELTATEIRARYRRPAVGTDNRSIRNLTDIIEGVELRQPPRERALVMMTYRINGKEERVWQYPEQQ